MIDDSCPLCGGVHMVGDCPALTPAEAAAWWGQIREDQEREDNET